uniref:Uncharacterized protein n=1 Tax=viral metagenome TaxID=1070528 RepID=A0A6C0HUE5_9ZZZZ
MNHYILSATSLFLLFPLFTFFNKIQKNIYETILAGLLIINILLSFLFWINPIEKCFVHKLDGIFGKISFVFFSIYTLLIKDLDYIFKLICWICFTIILYLFYWSSICSSNEWCCNNHLFCHSLFHLFISIACMLTFTM